MSNRFLHYIIIYGAHLNVSRDANGGEAAPNLIDYYWPRKQQMWTWWRFWFALYATATHALQQTLSKEQPVDPADGFYHLPHQVRRVAVIGGGPAGLQFTATLLDHGFEVRMFERAPQPGGNWYYTEQLPIAPSFPNRPIEEMAYVPDIPDKLPSTQIYVDGQDGLTVDWRIREHWAPSSTWFNMTTTDPYHMMSLPDISWSPNTPWRPNRVEVSRYVRQYASSVGLNSNDDEHANVTAYKTRVERAEKIPGTNKRWTLTLRKQTPLKNGSIEMDWWQEEFDAIVIGQLGVGDAAFVPPIPGLKEWAERLPDHVFHSRDYRRPQPFIDQNVLIVGGSVSGMGIANDLIGHARSVTVSTRQSSNPITLALRSSFPKNATFVSEIKSFSNLPSSSQPNLPSAYLFLANGSTITGYDAIILATGYRQSLPFLKGYHNSTIQGLDEPETIVAPIITDGTHIRSLHWTGHYIDDPTLLLCNTNPWTISALQYQALGTAKVWSGKARLPSSRRMWESYPGAGNILVELPLLGQIRSRLFVTWLNNEILEFGGRLVAPAAIDEVMELARYYTNKEWPKELAAFFEPGAFPSNERPRNQWGVYDHFNPRLGPPPDGDLNAARLALSSRHWADLSLQW
ncbi:FAD/NAD(P)-binding domain-containing protein [Clavulina sp. PMI_390]|nr:FAD/NAD(P)-binding domain-containing protein [Clavulina sp. PMI_390]